MNNKATALKTDEVKAPALTIKDQLAAAEAAMQAAADAMQAAQAAQASEAGKAAGTACLLASDELAGNGAASIARANSAITALQAFLQASGAGNASVHAKSTCEAPVAACKRIFGTMPSASRKDQLDACYAAGIAQGTAKTQIQRLRKDAADAPAS